MKVKINAPKIKLKTGTQKIKPSAESLDITPTRDAQSFQGLYNNVSVSGDNNLTAENIKKDVSIFGVEGIFEGEEYSINDASYLFSGGVRLDVMDQLINRCKNLTDTYNMFYDCTTLTELDLTGLNMDNLTNAQAMFQGCINLKSVTLAFKNQISSINFSSLFNNCMALTSVNTEEWKCKARLLMQIFYNCSSITSINLNGVDVSSVSNFQNAFFGCSNLVDLDISNWKMTGGGYWGLYTNNMLSNCPKLSNKSLDGIMKALTTVTNISASNKTLKAIGLSQEQVETCKTLSNYDAFIAAGWTTGY